MTRGEGDMRRLQTSLLVLAALLCTVDLTAGSGTSSSSSSPSSPSSSSTPTEMWSQREELHRRIKHSNITSNSQRSRPSSSSSSPSSSSSSSKLKEPTGHVSLFPSTTSRGAVPTVSSDRASERRPVAGPSAHCAYRVMEGGVGGPLCFRDTVQGFRCGGADCGSAVTRGDVVANLLVNGSVLLQWSHRGESNMAAPGPDPEGAAAGHRSRGDGGATDVLGRPRHRPGGFQLSCWWNGSYTQFECPGVHLGSGCRDFLLTELHENIPYRLCLRPLSSSDSRDCVEFTLPSSGMQDIVIAMTTVGGAICVMLVIICLLVAYITENIMSPATQHTYSYRTHSRH